MALARRSMTPVSLDSANWACSSGDEARHLFLEGVAVVFDFLGADVAAGREDVAVRGDFGGGGGFAEAGDVGILTRRRAGAEGFRGRGFFLRVLRASA
jgi:hypothetical protein